MRVTFPRTLSVCATTATTETLADSAHRVPPTRALTVLLAGPRTVRFRTVVPATLATRGLLEEHAAPVHRERTRTNLAPGHTSSVQRAHTSPAQARVHYRRVSRVRSTRIPKPQARVRWRPASRVPRARPLRSGVLCAGVRSEAIYPTRTHDVCILWARRHLVGDGRCRQLRV